MKQYDLCGLWRFQPDPHDDGESLGFYKNDYDVRKWREAWVPSSFDACLPELQQYYGVCWYRIIDPPDVTASQKDRILLRFQAANNRAKVWVNGVLVGEHRDPFLPFEFDITDLLSDDPVHSVVVKVDNSHHPGDVPGMHTGWHQAGGITREVELVSVPPRRISDASIVADHDGSILVSAKVTEGAAPGNLSAVVLDSKGVQVGALAPGNVSATEAELAGHFAGILAWEPDQPTLYTLRISLTDGSDEVDTREFRFGFCSINAKDGELLLNAKPIFLTGFNRHEDLPGADMKFDHQMTRNDLEDIKRTGANTVRLCHYPHHPAELDLCDEIGLLAFSEVPLYFWNDEDEGLATNQDRLESAERQLKAMIARDRNHPSIICWSVSNETNEQHEKVAAGNRKLISIARELDPSRLCLHVSNHWRDHPNFSDDDLICINGYPSLEWDRFRRGRQPGSDLAPGQEFWKEGISKLRGRYPDKPILVTEFGYCSLPGTFENGFGEDEHARVIEAEFSAISKEAGVCGGLIWCWADHPWPGGRFLGGMVTSPFGVVTRSRRTLKPLQAATLSFQKRQGLPAPIPTPSPDGTSVTMIRPNLNDIPDYELSAGYRLTPMTMAQSEIWTDIQRDAEPLFPITDDLFHNQFGDDPEAVSWRCFILRNEKGLGIGTISAWYNRDYLGAEWGQIHWVAIRPSYQGKGLSKPMLSDALKILARWHDKAYLGTDTKRIAAVALYLKFGFVPDMAPANARKTWGDFAKVYEHPAVRSALKN